MRDPPPCFVVVVVTGEQQLKCLLTMCDVLLMTTLGCRCFC